MFFSQVFALGQDDEDKVIWFRTGITPSEPGGKTWQRVVLEEHPDVFDLDSPACLMSRASQPSLYSPDDPFTMSDCFSASEVSFAAQMEDKSSVPMMTMISSARLPVKELTLDTAGTPPNLEALSADKASNGDFEGLQSAAGAKVKKRTQGTQMDGASSGRSLENPGARFQCEIVASVSKSREQTKSWQVIENSLQTSPTTDKKPVEAEEAVESIPVIPLMPSSIAAGTELSKYSSGSTRTCANNSAAEKSTPMKSASVRDGSSDTVKSTHKAMSPQQPLGESERSARFVGAHATSSEIETQETKVSLDPEADPSAVLNSSFHSDNFDSLESGPSSDVICNFVTDLIEDDNGDEDKEEEEKEKNGSGAQTHRAAGTDNGRVTFQDMHDQSGVASRSVDNPASIPWISMGPSETFTGRVAADASPSSDVEVIPAMTMTLAQPRYAWGWLAASDFMLENPSSVPWLSSSKGKLEMKLEGFCPLNCSYLLLKDFSKAPSCHNHASP